MRPCFTRMLEEVGSVTGSRKWREEKRKQETSSKRFMCEGMGGGERGGGRNGVTLAARRVWAAAAAVDFAPETSMLFEDRPVPLAWTLVPSMASMEGRATHRTRAEATTIPVWRVRQPFWTVPTSTAASPMELMPAEVAELFEPF